MNTAKLRPEIIEKAKRDGVLQQKIADATSKHHLTVYRWLNSNNPTLLRVDILSIISKHFELSDSDIITTEAVLNAE